MADLYYDLHIHSEYSSIMKQGEKVKSMSGKEFVDILLEKNVDVFSITDHNYFSATFYKEILEYIKDKEINIINGTELDIYIDEEKKDFFHAAFYFHPDTDINELENAIVELYLEHNKPLLSEIIQKFNSKRFYFIIIPEANKSRGILKIFRNLKGQQNNFLRNGMQKIFRAYDSTEKFDYFAANRWAQSYFNTTKEFSSIINGLTEDEKEELGSFVKDELETGVHDNDYLYESKVSEIVKDIKK